MTTKTTLSQLATAAAVAMMTAPQMASAEFVDYGALESAFGEPVTTSATGKPQRVSDAPMAMTIITSEQIHRAAAVDIPGILREYTDLDVLQWGRGANDVSVRGYDSAWSSRLLVLINGRQVYLDYRGFTNWQALPVQLSEIRQIEVVKGPNSALFGFNASGGVINIITFNPAYDTVNEATARIGSDGYYEGNGVATAKIGKSSGLRASVGAMNAHAFNTVSPDAPNGSPVNPQKRAINVDSVFDLGSDVQAGVEASYSDDSQYQYTDLTIAQHTETRAGSIKGTVNANTAFGQIEATAYHNAVYVTATYPATGGPVTIRTPLTVLKVHDLFKIGSAHAVRLGAEYRTETLDSMPIKGLWVTTSDYAASAMWDWAISQQWNWTNALRYDHWEMSRSGTPVATPFTNADFDKTKDEISVNSGLVYKATAVDSIRLSYGRGLQLPSLLQYNPQSSGDGLSLVGNPRLDPVVVTNYELGYSHDLTDLGARLTSSVFYQTNENMIALKPRTASPFLGNGGYVNVGDSSAVGVELGADGKTASGFRWSASWRFEDITESLSVNNSPMAYPIDVSGSAPHHLFTGRAGYTWGKADIDLFGRYSTSRSMPAANPTTMVLNDVTIPASFGLDLRMGYALTDNVSVALHGLNVQSKSTTYTPGPDVERQVYGTLNVKF